MNTVLVCIVAGRIYEDFARQMFATSAIHFRPTEQVEVVQLPGITSWPEATMMRPAILAAWLTSEDAQEFDYVYLIDADARFEEFVGPEILPHKNAINAVTATLHPGYVGKPPQELPYERSRGSTCSVLDGRGRNYYCGGFVGGEREAMSVLMAGSAELIATDLARGHLPLWHDESALNRLLADTPPSQILSPAYCMPDDDSAYRVWWPESYERRIVMLDKSPEQRANRGSS